MVNSAKSTLLLAVCTLFGAAIGVAIMPWIFPRAHTEMSRTSVLLTALRTDRNVPPVVVLGDSAVMAGRYEAHELPQLMQQTDWVIVPSRWWENSPLVIQEAFAHGRPVICSDIGGMAEKIVDRVNGLHFRAGDPASLAETIRTAVRDEELWERLRAEISPPHRMDEHIHRLEAIYNDLLDRPDRGPASGDVPQGLAS